MAPLDLNFEFRLTVWSPEALKLMQVKRYKRQDIHAGLERFSSL